MQSLYSICVSVEALVVHFKYVHTLLFQTFIEMFNYMLLRKIYICSVCQMKSIFIDGHNDQQQQRQQQQQ